TRWIIGVAIAFGAGLLFASGMDWTRLSFAQNKPSAAEIRPLTETGNAFVSIADHVTPAVVSIQAERKVAQAQLRQLPRGLPPGFEDFFNFGQPPGADQPQIQAVTGSGFLVSK